MVQDANFEATTAMNETKGGTPRRVHTLATVMPGEWGDGAVRKRRRRAAAAVDVNTAFVPLSESERRQIRCSPSRRAAGRRKAAGRPKGGRGDDATPDEDLCVGQPVSLCERARNCAAYAGTGRQSKLC